MKAKTRPESRPRRKKSPAELAGSARLVRHTGSHTTFPSPMPRPLPHQPQDGLAAARGWPASMGMAGVAAVLGVAMLVATAADCVHAAPSAQAGRSEEHTSELQSPCNLVCRLLLEKKKNAPTRHADLSAVHQGNGPHHPCEHSQQQHVQLLNDADAAPHDLLELDALVEDWIAARHG